MAIIAKCLLCEEKEVETFVSSSIIAKSEEEASQLLGVELVKHVMGSHPEKLGHKPTGRIDKASGGMEMGMSGEIPQIAVMVNGFLITRFFSSEDEKFEEQKEEMRDKLCEAIMWGAPMEEEEFEDEDLSCCLFHDSNGKEGGLKDCPRFEGRDGIDAMGDATGEPT